jgi:hypothetical protein
VDDLYGPCEDCADALLPGVLYPVSQGQDPSETAAVVACECGEYASDEEAGDALAEEVGSDYRSDIVAGAVVLRDSAGTALTVGRALEVLAEMAEARTGSLSETGSSSSSSSASSRT